MRGGIPDSRNQPPSTIAGIPHAGTINTIASEQLSYAMESATQEAVIMELTRRLADSEGQIRSVLQQNAALETYVQQYQQDANNSVSAEAYDSLLAGCMEREKELRIATDMNLTFDKKQIELEQLVNELQNNSTLQGIKLQENEEQLKKMGEVEAENKSNRAAVLEAEDIIKRHVEVIEYLNTERDELIAKSKESEKKMKQMEDELTEYQELLGKSKGLAEEQINVLLENEKTIGGLEDKNAELEEVIETLKTIMKKNFESKDTLLNMQRQELEDKDAMIKMYQTKFEAKNVNVPLVLARADEGDRVWAKIEEREKRFAAKEIMMSALHDENGKLHDEKKALEAEVYELKKCFELTNLKLSGTNDKVHMPWLLAQLRESVSSKEKAKQLEEIVRCEGYTVKAKEAENSYKKKSQEMTLKLARVNQIIDALKGQTNAVQDMELPTLLGKLEECLYEFEEDDDIVSQILTATSSDINQSISLNSSGSYPEDTNWRDRMCLTPRDFKELMHPDHYANICSPANGDVDDEDEEELMMTDEGDYDKRDDAVGNHAVDNEDDKSDSRNDEGEEEEVCEDDDDDEQPDKSDIHIEKVLKILQKDESDPEDWRKWITPPSSPRNVGPTTE